MLWTEVLMVLRGLRNSKKRLDQVLLSGIKRPLIAIGQAKSACEDMRMIRVGLRKWADRGNLIAYGKSY